MKKLFNGLKMRQSKEVLLIKNNQQEITSTNKEYLNYLLTTSIVISVLLMIISAFYSDFSESRFAFSIGVIISIIFCFFAKTLKSNFSILAGLYIFGYLMLSICIYLSAFVSPQHLASSIVALFCIFPLVILDKSWRINLTMIIFYIIHCIFAELFKSPDIVSSDIVNILCFLIVGIVMGETIRKTKLENIDLRRHLQRQSQIDFLTGLYNRRKMFDIIRENESNASCPHFTGAIMLDVDFFKNYNDAYGHQAGDDCLYTLSSILLKISQKHDIDCFRYGGEEFTFLSCNKTSDEIYLIGKEINEAISAANISFSASAQKHITVSVGVAWESPDSDISTQQLISMADKALYYCKGNGRNCATLYTDSLMDITAPHTQVSCEF